MLMVEGEVLQYGHINIVNRAINDTNSDMFSILTVYICG